MQHHTPTLKDLLQKCSVEVLPETYNLIKLETANWKEIISKAELSPRGSAPYMIFFESDGVTLLLDDEDFSNIRSALNNAKAIRNLRSVKLFDRAGNDIHQSKSLVLDILAEKEIFPLVLSGIDNDKYLIDQGLISNALKALGPFVGELC